MVIICQTNELLLTVVQNKTLQRRHSLPKGHAGLKKEKEWKDDVDSPHALPSCHFRFQELGVMQSNQVNDYPANYSVPRSTHNTPKECGSKCRETKQRNQENGNASLKPKALCKNEHANVKLLHKAKQLGLPDCSDYLATNLNMSLRPTTLLALVGHHGGGQLTGHGNVLEKHKTIPIHLGAARQIKVFRHSVVVPVARAGNGFFGPDTRSAVEGHKVKHTLAGVLLCDAMQKSKLLLATCKLLLFIKDPCIVYLPR